MKLLPSCNPLDEQLLYQSDNQSIVASLISLCSQMQKKHSQNSKKKNCGNFFFFFFFNFHRNFQNMKMALSMFLLRVVPATLDHMLRCACLKKATVLP
jgi:hypothetical protein